MRILLINPFYPISENPSPPLGLAYLSSSLKKNGCDVKLLDFVVFPYSKKKLEQTLNDFTPDIAGITSVTMTFYNAMDIAKDVKSIEKSILTVLGGPHVSFCPQDIIKSENIDFIVIGEGEETIVNLVNALKNDNDLNTVNGIFYKKNGKIIFNDKNEFIKDINLIPPPDRSIIPLGRYRALGMPITMTTSRGCPYKCIFCVGRKMVGQKVRYLNFTNVVNDFEYLSKLNFHQINIADDLFTANKKHCLNVANEIIKRKLKVKWTSFARVDSVDNQLLEKMKEAGCVAVSFGIETGSDKILKTIKKGITKKQVIEAVKLCNNAGILPHGSFILGLPGETPETLKETICFGKQLEDLGLCYGFHLLAPFPGTKVYDNYRQYGIKITTNDWSQYHANRAIVETDSVNQTMLNDIVIKYEQKYNKKLDEIKVKMKNNQASEDEKFPLVNLERIVLIYDLMMNNVLEKYGNLDLNCNYDSDILLKTLSKKIAEFTKYKADQTNDVLTFLFNNNDLSQSIKDNKINFSWNNYL